MSGTGVREGYNEVKREDWTEYQYNLLETDQQEVTSQPFSSYSFPTMPPALEQFERIVLEETSQQDLLDMNLKDLTLEDESNLEDGFFPKTPDSRRRGNSSLGLGTRELAQPYQASPSRKSTGNLRHMFRPRDNIAMRGDMDLVTEAQQRDSAGLGGFRSHSVKPRHSLALDGMVEYRTNNKEFRGQQASKATIEKPRNHLKAKGDIDLRTTTLESFKEKRAERSGIEKPRHHLSATGKLDLKTTTSENFSMGGKADRAERIDRDNLKVGGERNLQTTHRDYQNYGSVSPSDIRAAPSWYSQPSHNPIIIS